MNIEKLLQVTDGIRKLMHLQIKEQLRYEKEAAGMRAVGTLLIEGLYETAQGSLNRLQETLDMDVLAPKEKLGDEPFSLEISEYHGEATPEGLLLHIVLLAKGLKEEGATVPQPAEEESMSPAAATSDTEATAIATVAETAAAAVDTSQFEDLFEDADTTYTSCRMVVAGADDTYATLAQRYAVNEAQLRACNHDKDITAKVLVLLPKDKQHSEGG